MLVRAQQCNFPPALRVGESVQFNALAVMAAAGSFRVQGGQTKGRCYGRACPYFGRNRVLQSEGIIGFSYFAGRPVHQRRRDIC